MRILCVSQPLVLVPLLENNQVFFQIIIALFQITIAILTLSVGVISILIGVSGFIGKRRREAQVGFYVNLLVFLEGLSSLIKEYPNLLELLLPEKLRETPVPAQMPSERAKIVCPIFSKLCKDLISFLSTATNNIPPTANKPDDAGWAEWYLGILALTRFLYKGTVIGELCPYMSMYQYEQGCLEVAEKIIPKIQILIKKRLGIPSNSEANSIQDQTMKPRPS